MWSCGCILGELLLGKPVFPGTSTMNQLDRIMEVTGKPTPEDIESIQSPFAATMLDSLAPQGQRALHHMFPNASVDALDLMRKLLQFNPEDRLSAEEALRHPYVRQFHNSADEPVRRHPITIPIDDNVKYSISEYREMLYGEIIRRKKELKRRLRERESIPSSSSASHHSNSNQYHHRANQEGVYNGHHRGSGPSGQQSTSSNMPSRQTYTRTASYNSRQGSSSKYGQQFQDRDYRNYYQE
eukprot:TRINITY_DN21067_c0_g1_i9.p1 TRINITY_DN21067_c0_g1~~TRINITY_DN21067_c0_g1_i9.p1  ORF type:complete len:241 (+),score=31.23 TRINITY_DN21067_c0_g1_i9:229-951(+)